MNRELIYTLKIWITAVIVVPILLTAFDYHQRDLMEDTIGYAFVAMMVGGFMSIPSFVLLLLTVRLSIKHLTLNYITLKLLWSGASILFTTIPFMLFNGVRVFTSGGLGVILFYFSAIVFGIWIYRVKPKTDNHTSEDERLFYSSAKP